MLGAVNQLSNKTCIYKYLSSNDILMHIYEIGDLDDYFWPSTKWFAYIEDSAICAVALMYYGADCPVLLLFGNVDFSKYIIQHITTLLPNHFYAHLSIGVSSTLTDFTPSHIIKCCKMGLIHKELALAFVTSNVVRISEDDVPFAQRFYDTSYPGHWFDPKRINGLITLGIWDSDSKCLLAAAGTHVCSVEYRVASLGNIAVHPDYRGRGLATCVVAGMIQWLLWMEIEHIALNVYVENTAAIRCYQKLGFEIVGHYEEAVWDKKQL